MFGALRRCPASLPKNAAILVSFPRTLRVPHYQTATAIKSFAPRLNNSAIATFHSNTKWQQVAAAEHATEPAQQELVTEFSDLATRKLVHPNIINVITKQMKIDTMTEVQTRTINEGLSGTDVIAQAKTGTGKTLGFLIPIVQRMINEDPKLGERPRGYKRARPDDIRAIVISPTRELAEQIAVEAKKITAGTGIVVQIAVGGTQKRAMLMQTQREGCHLLIGTPGRLCDIFSDPYSGVKAPKLNALVMDEADRLLDDGFTKEIDEIKKYLPDPEEVDRQTMMFSATVPRDVVDLVRRTLKPGFHFANCVDDAEAPTHERVLQKLVNLHGYENAMPALYELVTKEMAASQSGDSRPFKAIVYFNSTAEVTLSASVFFKLSGGFKRGKPLSGLSAFEIHSKLTQAQRSKASDNFRHAKSGILFSSDVTARGMDFPNVTHVIQMGLPRERDTYVHRIGRTGRAGKEGEGWLFLSPLEFQEVRKRLRGMPLREDETLETAAVDMSAESQVPENVSNIFQQVTEAYKKVYPDQLDAAFRGFFGAFQWFPNKTQLVDAANRLATIGWGMEFPPPPPASLYGGGGRARAGGPRGGFTPRREGGGFGERSNSGGFGDRSRSGSFDDKPRSGGYGGRFQSGGSGGRSGSGGFGGSRQPRSQGQRNGGAGAFGERKDRMPDFY
ncbi:ATP-dependent RNA helicase mss116 mitochondrial precursor [Dendryphion nanum]|uniref:ATP-dependent RNA helicase n=1 Tax=Dendryphion nanum TaxID=256645 RepID=A0A9P9IW18_9PLEO|nr:ATP-dependent RNA helicase mss116 mitochondrial precursor [Dendryphion nanum]